MEKEMYEIFYRVEKSHWWFHARCRIILSFLARIYNPSNGVVLDVGCGTGAVLEELSNRYNAWGLDISPDAVRFCKQRGITKVFEGEIATFQQGEDEIQLITLLDVIEHLDDDQAMLAACHEKLKPGGYIIITVPAYRFLWSAHDIANRHKRRYVKSMLASAVIEAGFSIAKISYYNTFLFPLMALSRLSERAFGSKTSAERLRVPLAPLNSLLKFIFAFERHLLMRVTFPFGGSLLCIGRKSERG